MLLLLLLLFQRNPESFRDVGGLVDIQLDTIQRVTNRSGAVEVVHVVRVWIATMTAEDAVHTRSPHPVTHDRLHPVTTMTLT